eukprot:4709494-Prymnesium_polylepis.1
MPSPPPASSTPSLPVCHHRPHHPHRTEPRGPPCRARRHHHHPPPRLLWVPDLGLSLRARP